MCRLLGTDIENARLRELTSVPLSLGRLGLRSATRTREAACWASWARLSVHGENLGDSNTAGHTQQHRELSAISGIGT